MSIPGSSFPLSSVTLQNPSPPNIGKTVKILAITQIALLAFSFTAVCGFVIAAAVTSNGYLLIGAGIAAAIALAVLGRNFCGHAMAANGKKRLFVATTGGPYNEQPFVTNFGARSGELLAMRKGPSIQWPAGRQIPGTLFIS